MVSRPSLQPGDQVALGSLADALFTIIKREKNTWVVQRTGSTLPERIADEAMIEANREQKFWHWPHDAEGRATAIARKTESAFDAWPAHSRRECLRRLTYVQAVDRVRDMHRNDLNACAAIIPEVWAENSEHWKAEERDAAVKKTTSARRRDGTDQDDEEATYKIKDVKMPAARTLRKWYVTWMGEGRNEMALMPDYGARGWHGPHEDVAKTEGETDVYQLMEEAIRGNYLSLLKRSKQIAFEAYEKLCAAKKLVALSNRTFRRYINKVFTDYEQYAAKHGKKAAHLRFGIFALRELPDRPLEEVEIDHCLVDMIVIARNGMRLGRPWITVAIDRATKCIVGVHVSFMPPSYLSIQRALAHIIYEKDLSNFPGLKNDWPCYGLPEWIISDRGKEFLSRSFRTACLLLRIYTIALPGRKPWLKASIERLFHTAHARVFDLHEGSTKAWDADTYNSFKRAEKTEDDFNRMLVEWIVDDYHQKNHPALKKKYGHDMTPHEAWVKLVDRYGVRFPPQADHVYRLTGEIFERKILRTGIHIKGHIYINKPLLERLAGQTGGLDREYTFRRDRADLGRIWILVEGEGWHEIRNANYALTNGVTDHQYGFWKANAVDNLAEGEALTVEALMKGRERVEKKRDQALGSKNLLSAALKWAKYGSMSASFTPVPCFGPTGDPVSPPVLIGDASAVILEPELEPEEAVEPDDEIADAEWEDVVDEAVTPANDQQAAAIRAMALARLEEMKL